VVAARLEDGIPEERQTLLDFIGAALARQERG
jgi:hypothetical protein